MPPTQKDWDEHVVEAEDLARTPGFQHLRDRIIALAQPREDDVVVDVGAGTGLLTLAMAPVVSKVWAIDISPAMLEYLATKAASGELHNVETTTATAASLPLMDKSVSLVVSNYCYHHLSDDDKQRAIAEAFRVLRPEGRIVISDMMFRMQVTDERSRRVILSKVKAILKRGPAGLVRLLKNALRLLSRRWEHPADSHWWQQTLKKAGFEDVEIELLEHEGGIVTARRPGRAASRRGALRRRGLAPPPEVPRASSLNLRLCLQTSTATHGGGWGSLA
jgi:ubiquinone/menaquinone biosynthesis C-methylase UbiE